MATFLPPSKLNHKIFVYTVFPFPYHLISLLLIQSGFSPTIFLKFLLSKITNNLHAIIYNDIFIVTRPLWFSWNTFYFLLLGSTMPPTPDMTDHTPCDSFLSTHPLDTSVSWTSISILTLLFILMLFSWVAFYLIASSLGHKLTLLGVMIKIPTSCTWHG